MIRFLASLFGLVPTITIVASDHRPISGSDVTLAISRDGKVYSTGDEVDIRGDKRPGTRCHFERIEELSDVVSVDVCVNGSAAGALDQQGNVWLWGRQWASILRGEESDTHVPTQHPGLKNVRSFSLADSHLIALKGDGSVVTAGCDYDANNEGQLGTGDLETPPPSGPTHGVVSIGGINDAVAVEAGGDFNLILRKDGTVWGVGNARMLGEATGAIGRPNEEPKRNAIAKPISGLSNIAAISAGHQFAIALDRSGQVWGWGYNHSGQLGPVVSDLVSIAPTKIRGFNRVASIAAGYDFVLAATQAGKVIAMGGNVYGALGDDGGELEGAKRTISKLSGVKEVFAGHYSGFARTTSGEIWGWGSNSRTVGGFHATSDEGFLAPTKIDVMLKPMPLTPTVAGGGVKANVILRLQSYFFESQSMKLTVGDKIVGSVELNEQQDEKSYSLEIPAGTTSYEVTGTGVDDSGKVTPIKGRGVFIVAPQTVGDDFKEKVKQDGLIVATKAMKEQFDAAIGDSDYPSVSFSHTEPLEDEDLDQIEAKLEQRLPASYRHVMKTIGPFRIGATNSPHPRASLMVPDAGRNLLSYAQAAERYSQEEATEIKSMRLPKNDLFRDIIDQFGYMRDELNGSEAVKDRPNWERDLIVGATEDDLYLLIGGGEANSDRRYATLWAPFFHEEQDDDGNSRGYFQWAEAAGSDTNEEVEEHLADAVYSALVAEYSVRGITPIQSTPTNEVQYVLFDIQNEEEPEGDDPYEGICSSDGW